MGLSSLKHCLSCALASAMLLSVTVAHAQESIQVETNQARIVKLPRPADTIVVGNPQIADVAVQDEDTLVLTGKGFGVTNLVVLAEDGTTIVDRQITVSRQTATTLRVYRRADVQTLSCTPYCEAAFKSQEETRSDASMGAQ